MTSPPPPLALIEKTVKRMIVAEQARNDAIRQAFDPALRGRFGYTVEDVARAAGLTRERIYQIVKEPQ